MRMQSISIKIYKLVTLISIISLTTFANASQEGILSFSEFKIKSNGIGDSGSVEIIGISNEKGALSSLTVNAFGEVYIFPKNILNQIPAHQRNGIQLTYEAGYRSMGGKTIYIQFHNGFTSGMQSSVLVSLDERSVFELLK